MAMGDEKIWVDDDKISLPISGRVRRLLQLFLGACDSFLYSFWRSNTADAETSIGYNTFFRTRNLDQIPFNKNLRFDIEMLSWISGEVDYATTVYWYGDLNAKAEGMHTGRGGDATFVTSPADPAAYKIAENAIEFEKLTPVAKSGELFTRTGKAA